MPWKSSRRVTPRSSARLVRRSNASSWRIDRNRDPCPSLSGSSALSWSSNRLSAAVMVPLMQKFSSQHSCKSAVATPTVWRTDRKRMRKKNSWTNSIPMLSSASPASWLQGDVFRVEDVWEILLHAGDGRGLPASRGIEPAPYSSGSEDLNRFVRSEHGRQRHDEIPVLRKPGVKPDHRRITEAGLPSRENRSREPDRPALMRPTAASARRARAEPACRVHRSRGAAP